LSYNSFALYWFLFTVCDVCSYVSAVQHSNWLRVLFSGLYPRVL
jgi:hypothetical protein